MTNDLEILITGQQFKKLYEKKYEHIMDTYGLRKIDIDILYFLSTCQYDTAKDIANLRYFSKAHISKSIEHLTEKKYICHYEDAHDRRCVHLKTTSLAQPLIEQIGAVKKDMAALLYQNITEEELATLQLVAKKIAHNIHKELERSVQNS